MFCYVVSVVAIMDVIVGLLFDQRIDQCLKSP